MAEVTTATALRVVDSFSAGNETAVEVHPPDVNPAGHPWAVSAQPAVIRNAQFAPQGNHPSTLATAMIETDMADGIKKRTLTMVNFQRKKAIVFTMPKQQPALPEEARRPAVPVGNDTHDGRPVIKAHIQTVDGRMQEIWTAEDIGLVVFTRLDTPTATTTSELKNVALGEPNGSVFAIPQGYSVRREAVPPTRSATLPWPTPPGQARRPQR